MRLLLDTCVLSEFNRLDADENVRAALFAIDESELFTSVIAIGEIAKGIRLLANGRRKQKLAIWFDRLRSDFGSRILAIDAETALIWGDITANARNRGLVLPTEDGLIAATALQHDLAVMTRNVKDFESSGVRLMNPWKTSNGSE